MRTTKQLRATLAGLLLMLLPVATSAQEQVEMTGDLETVVVLGTRPGERVPITKQKIAVKKLQQQTTAWDIPSLLKGTPSLVTTNESGVFGGYTYFTVRGVDPTRVNITVNGVPVNDSESQTVFWPSESARLRFAPEGYCNCPRSWCLLFRCRCLWCNDGYAECRP